MILFQDNKAKLEISPMDVLDSFTDIKSVESPSTEKVRGFWDKLFGVDRDSLHRYKRVY